MARRRHELTDTQWEQIRDPLPGKAGDPGRTAADNRLFVNAVPFVLKAGVPWEDLPPRHGEPNSVWKRCDRWCAKGVWERLAKAVGDPDLDELHLDSTTKIHAAVTGAGRVVRLVLSPGQAGDAPRAPALLDGLWPGHVVADAAYGSDAVRQQVRRAKARACIRPNPTRRRRKRYDRERPRTTSGSLGSRRCSSASDECPHDLGKAPGGRGGRVTSLP